ncbi:MAG: bifunctional 4-hydroxy-2-oxoglutarate aldolase/2-dehydro-3-deoxy-phosphogluconate aldolase [Polyangiaceae bacterium]
MTLPQGDPDEVNEIRMSRLEICRRIEETGIVPVVRAPSPAVAVAACHAVYAGGVDIVEVTMTVPGAIDVISQLAQEFSGRLLIGAGTVLDAQTARACITAGAEFVVSPGLDVEIIRVCHSLGRPCMPGVLTPTEIMIAQKAQADVCKVFPCAAVGGPDYLSALRGPFPNLKFMPTGGVDLQTAADYLEIGSDCVGSGFGPRRHEDSRTRGSGADLRTR